MGPGVAMECLETTDGPTIWEDHSILKLLILMTAHRLPMVNMANCYSPR